MSRYLAYCKTLGRFVYVDEPCPLQPPLECLYKETKTCPLVR